MTSAILTKLAETYPEVLTNPEKYLGPNALNILGLWERIDSFDCEEKTELNRYYLTLDSCTGFKRDSSADAAYYAAKEVVGEKFTSAAWWAVINVTKKCIFSYATLELIGELEHPIFSIKIMCYKNRIKFANFWAYLNMQDLLICS
jgi:hypothetical protein